MPLAEAQAKLVAAKLSGGYDLPNQAQRKQRTQRARAEMLERYVPSRRHTMQLDYDEYMAELAREGKAGGARAQHRRARAVSGSQPSRKP